VVRYEESQVHEHIYQLHVKLLTADGQTVISEHHVEPTEDRSNYKHTWKEVCRANTTPYIKLNAYTIQ
jgi:hypothetical protein